MSAGDIKILDFTDTFEQEFIQQGEESRDILHTLDTGLSILKAYNLDSL